MKSYLELFEVPHKIEDKILCSDIFLRKQPFKFYPVFENKIYGRRTKYIVKNYFCRDKPNTLKIRSVLWFYRFSWGISIFDELQCHQIKVWKISCDWLPNNYHVSNAIIIPVSKMPTRPLTGQTSSNKLPWQLRGILICFEIFQPFFSEESTWVEVLVFLIQEILSSWRWSISVNKK